MTEKQIKIIAKYTGVKELESVGEKSNYHIFTPIESNNDIIVLIAVIGLVRKSD